MKGIVSTTLLFSVVVLSQGVFAQEALHEAVDSGDLAAVKKMVKKGEIEEIYCGKLSANDAASAYEKIFKQMPDESFAACPSQFAYGYGVKVCGNAKALNACTEVVTYLLNDGLAGNVNALDALDKVAKAALKTKAFAKPVKEQVDTTMWVACPKKGKAKEECLAQCIAQADSMYDVAHKLSCPTKPEHYVDTTVMVSKPSPLYEKLTKGFKEGFWSCPMSVAEKFANLMQANAKALSIPDTAIPSIKYVQRWAEQHKADSTALPGGQLFRFCTAWQPQVDSVLASLELEARCPVFETFTDPRDGQVYKVKDINGVKWFVQNLNYALEEGSICYDREDENCKAYGRLYTQETAKTACPDGSRLATDDDWKMLEVYAGGASEAAVKLRSNGSDDFAFTAMFGGYANKNGISTTIGEGAYFWTDKADGDKRGTARSMFSTDKEVSSISVDKEFYLAVRCIKMGE
ncbi:FISUMP domain-containing protein [uncultured Fibrobacter sp.]|uniref:FISUMP domain-containing protein n=1 Tax=uncultured Fibrobacter sp. TaxID=261512 RepID=UPI0025E3C86B|nr:FISUMP domain-containing protein [uncultured Fibrobacter sp.]